MDKNYFIKETSRLTGLSPSNIRYYEREGLINNIERDTNGIRRFSEKELEWIRFLGKLKEMEMPIGQMKQYTLLRAQGNSTIVERAQILEQHKQFILRKMDRLQKSVQLLENKIEVYKKMEKTNNE